MKKINIILFSILIVIIIALVYLLRDYTLTIEFPFLTCQNTGATYLTTKGVAQWLIQSKMLG